jgi:hypothetical protein
VKAYEALAEAFAAEGTSDVFGMMGDANMHWMDALAQRGVWLYEVRHEGSGSVWPTGGRALPGAQALSRRPAGREPRSSPPR